MDDFVASFDALFENRWADVQAAFSTKARSVGINVRAAISQHQFEVTQIAMSASTKSRARLKVFAAERRSKAKSRQRELLKNVAFLCGGVIITKLADLMAWLLRSAHLLR
jgi:hypothetical protein